ncbi:hypothetical protein SDC9_187376 [bioreactor metagenome]|uniref:Uncharacterized protein n=1 Tax=bioreactor metagenome TaxID=1076179 RepID=A0A645HN19_9ZZZZ
MIGRRRRRLHDDRNVAKTRFALHPAEQFHAIEFRHHAVEHHQRKIAVGSAQARPGIHRIAVHLELDIFLLEKFLDDEQVQLFIINNEDTFLIHCSVFLLPQRPDDERVAAR